jgi:hypothetical protein
LIIKVEDGAFTRHYPSLGSSDEERALVDSVEITDDGWACDPSAMFQLEGNYGDPSPGKIR